MKYCYQNTNQYTLNSHMILANIHAEEIDRHRNGTIPSLLKDMSEGKVDRQELKLIVDRRYQVAHFFEDWLRHIISVVYASHFTTTEKLTLARAAEENLKEELGEVEQYGGPHKNGRIVQLRALNINPVDWESQLGSYSKLGPYTPTAARHLIEELKRIASLGAIEAITALWYYENRISLDGVRGDYYMLLNAMKKAYPEFRYEKEGDALYHIASHAKHDEFHAHLAEIALEQIEHTDKEKIIEKVCTQCRSAIDRFWDEVLP